jgi:hypothetical protein
MSDLSNYRIYCNDETTYVYVWSRTKPTECPNNAGHELDATSFAIVETKKDISYIVSDIKIKSTGGGGQVVNKTWFTRTLNDCVSFPADSKNIVLNGDDNEFTIKNSGTYSISVKAPAYNVKSHKCRLVATPTGPHILNYYVGTTEFSDKAMTSSIVECNVEINTGTKFNVEHWCEEEKDDKDLGIPCGATDASEIYTYVKILLLS